MKQNALVSFYGWVEVIFDLVAAVVVVLSVSYLIRGLMDSPFYLWSVVIFVLVLLIRQYVKHELEETYSG